MVKKQADPPENWETYSVNILGDAETYDKALEKLKRLEVEQHAFSLESDEDLEDRQDKVLQEIKRQKLLDEEAELDAIVIPSTKHFEFDEDIDVTRSVKTPRTANHMTDAGTESDTAVYSASDEALDHTIRHVSLQVLLSKKKGSSQNSSAFAQESYCGNYTERCINEPVNTATKSKPNPEVMNLDLPVISIPSVNSSSEFQTAVLTSLSLMHVELQRTNKRLDNIENFLCDKEVFSSDPNVIDFNAKYDFRLPMDDKATFIRFNEELSTNKCMKKEVILMLTKCLDADLVITKSMLAMLKRFIAKPVAIQYTAARKSSKSSSDQKDIFKRTHFCTAMEYVISNARKEKTLETSDKSLTKGLSDVLCNSMYWDVKRPKK